MSTDVNRYWTRWQWTGQNVAAVVAAAAAAVLIVETHTRLIMVAVLVYGIVNGLLGLRRNWWLGVVGFASGIGFFLGTGFMILLTWRWRVGRTRQ